MNKFYFVEFIHMGKIVGFLDIYMFIITIINKPYNMLQVKK